MSSHQAGRLSFRDQFFQDLTIALGSLVIVTDVAGSLNAAGVISRAQESESAWWVLVPFAVCYWHAGWRPAPPPPAGRWRRVLTFAGAGLALALWLAGSAAAVVLIVHGRMSWQDFPLAATVGAYLSLSAAGRAARNWGPATPGPSS